MLRSKDVIEEEEGDIEPIDPNASLVSPMGCIEGKPVCEGTEIVDVMIFTGSGPDEYQVLTEEQQKDVLQEAEILEGLSKEFQALQEEAPEESSADDASIEAYQKKKQAWINKAERAGLFQLEPKTVKKTGSVNAQKIANRRKEIEDRKKTLNTFYLKAVEYPTDETGGIDEVSYYNVFPDESSKQFFLKVMDELNAELVELGELATQDQENNSKNSQNEAENNTSGSSSVQSVDIQKLGTQRKPYHRANSFFKVKEFRLLGQERRLYIRESYLRSKKTLGWIDVINHTHLNAARLKPNVTKTELVQGILKDIKRGVVKDFENGPFNKLEQVWLNNPMIDEQVAEWRFTQNFPSDDGSPSQFAVNGEAQLMRFCLNSQVKNVFERKEGKVALGASVNASLSLAEGFISLVRKFPHAEGVNLYLPYKDAYDNDARYPFGHFRITCTATLNCFVGATGSASGTTAVQTNNDKGISKREELESAGASVLLANNINLDVPKGAGGEVALKAEGFVGAQVGGKLEGSLDWKAPALPKGTKTTEDDSQSFATLAKVEAAGNVSIGAGASWEFRLELVDGEFILYTKASLAFGPGAGGGFGTTVDVTELWPLVKVIWGGLMVIDYRTLECVNAACYEFLVRAAYYFFTIDLKTTLKDTISEGSREIADWWREQKTVWDDKNLRQAEAERISQKLTATQGTFNGIDINQLPPETIGMLLDTLVETFIDSREESQEKAINILLTGCIGSSWRKFEEVLAHMNPQGKKEGDQHTLLTNLERINDILDGSQQAQFNTWVMTLAKGGDDINRRGQQAFKNVSTETLKKKKEHLKREELMKEQHTVGIR